MDVGLRCVEQQLARNPADQARGIADHGAGVLLGPAILDGFGVEEDVAVGGVQAIELAFERPAPRQQHGTAGAQRNHHIGAVDQPVDRRVTHQFTRQIAGDPLPAELAADLHVAQPQVVERHHHDEAIGVVPEQPPPEIARRDGAGHLEHDPRARGLGGSGLRLVARHSERRRPEPGCGTESQVRVVEDHQIGCVRFVGGALLYGPACRFDHLVRAPAIQSQELLDAPDRAIPIALLAWELGPHGV